MTRLEKQLSSAIEKMHSEHLQQVQQLQRQVEGLQAHVMKLTNAYNQVAQLLQDK